jgi:hypothetical protein
MAHQDREPHARGEQERRVGDDEERVAQDGAVDREPDRRRDLTTK